MQPEPSDNTPDTAPQHDPYGTGGDWPIEQLVKDWNLDPATLRRTLNLIDHGVRMARAFDGGARSAELEDIADKAASLVVALEKASTGSLTHVLILAPCLHPSDVLNHPDACRKQFLDYVRWLRTTSRKAGRSLKKIYKEDGKKAQFKQPPRSRTGPKAPPSIEERSIVYGLADIWFRTHKKWPRFNKNVVGKRVPNQGARFVIAAALSAFGLSLEDERLRSILRSLGNPAAKA
jgi:hypothetical protein